MTTHRKRLLAIGVIAAVLGGVLAWQYLRGPGTDGALNLSGTIEADEIHVGSRVGGRIAEVLVHEGQEVEEGQPMVRFESYDLGARKADAAAAVARANANYEKALRWFRPEEVAEARARAEAAWMNLELARNGPRRQEIDAARAELAAAEADYQVARSTLGRVEQLASSGVASRQDLDDAKAAFDRAAARREAARQQLDLLLAGTRPEEIERAQRLFEEAAARRQLVEAGGRREDIDAARAQLEGAQAVLQQIETQIGELEVLAPARAAIEVMQVRPGDLITPGAPVAVLVETNRLWVRVYVPEPELGNVQLGKEVRVTVDTYRGEGFAGRIEHVASRGEFTPRNVQTREERAHQVFAVRVRVDNSQKKLRAGMAAEVSIPR